MDSVETDVSMFRKDEQNNGHLFTPIFWTWLPWRMMTTRNVEAAATE